MGKYDFDCEPLPKVHNGELTPTKKEYEALSALRIEHEGKERFTRYFKDENEQSQPLCSYMIMQRLEEKFIVTKDGVPKNNESPQFYRWGVNADCW